MEEKQQRVVREIELNPRVPLLVTKQVKTRDSVNEILPLRVDLISLFHFIR